MLIPIQEARMRFTNSFLGSWKETFPVTNFFRSFFEDKVSPTKYVSIEVSRGTKLVASDVTRGDQANRNKFGLSTMKTFEPPYYFEGFDNTELALYDQLFGGFSEVTDSSLLVAAVQEITTKNLELKNKIERAYEIQAGQVLQTGKVTTKNLDIIDFKAKSSHIRILDTKWDDATPNIFAGLQIVFDQLRTDGAAAVEFDMIMGSLAAQSFLTSVEYLKYFRTYPQVPSAYILPQYKATTGATFHNRISVGPYLVNLWSYNASYTNDSGIDTPFMDPKKVVIKADSFKGYTSFAAVPRVLTAPNTAVAPQYSQVIDAGKFILNNYVDQRTATHYFDMKSAGLAIPMTVDHFACLTVLG